MTGGRPDEPNLGARIAQYVEQAHGTYPDERPPEALQFGRFRLFCSMDLDQIAAAGGTFSIIHAFAFGRGEPFQMERLEFDDKLANLQAYTRQARARGISAISYVSQNVSTSREADPAGWIMSDVWADEQRWNSYADLYGERPDEPPSEWLQIRADGVYGGHVWIPPGATDQRHYELRGCPHSPGFRHYMAGIINVLLAAGIGGIYLDHSEVPGPFSRDSARCFRDFLSARYGETELQDRFGISDISQAMPVADLRKPLGAETVLFQAASEAEFHQYLRDHAREKDPDFIIAGNLWGGFGFQSAALNGSDIQLAGMVDTFLYSELATGTESAERGQRNLPGTRSGVRTSMAPLVRVLPASSRTGAATSYTYYPQTPNPIPTEEALFNIQRLAMAEAFANHTAFRRVESGHAEPVHRAAKSLYDLLQSIEDDILGAEMASGVAVVASLQTCYFGRYSYHLEVSRALADAGIAHEMLAPRNLQPDKLSQYRVVVLPNTAVLSEEAHRALTQYGRGDGAVVAFGEVGVLNERGVPGPGVGTTGGESPFTWLSLDAGKAAADALLVHGDRDFKLHAAYACGQWPEELRPTMEALLDAVEDAAAETLTARRHDLPSVEISAMRRPASTDFLVHAVNYSVNLEGRVTPAESVRISVAHPDAKPVTGVSWRALDGVTEELEVRPMEHRAGFIVPRLDIYGIAIVRAGS